MPVCGHARYRCVEQSLFLRVACCHFVVKKLLIIRPQAVAKHQGTWIQGQSNARSIRYVPLQLHSLPKGAVNATNVRSTRFFRANELRYTGWKSQYHCEFDSDLGTNFEGAGAWANELWGSKDNFKFEKLEGVGHTFGVSPNEDCQALILKAVATMPPL